MRQPQKMEICQSKLASNVWARLWGELRLLQRRLNHQGYIFSLDVKEGSAGKKKLK
jgi:hypothetical protein